MATSKLNVLFISKWYPNKFHPTLGDFVQRHAQSVALYHDVYFLHVLYDPTLKKNVEILERTEGSFHETFIYFSTSNKLLKNYLYIKYYHLGYKKILQKAKKIDILHANIIYNIFWVVRSFYKKYRIPYIFSENWTGFVNKNYEQLPWITKYFLKKTVNKASCLFPVSKNLENKFIEFKFTPPSLIVPNVAEHRFFKLAANPGKIKRIIHVSSLNDAHKNIRGLLHVMKRISDTRQDVELLIMSSFSIEPYQEHIRTLNIPEGIIRYIPFSKQEELAEKMAECDFFVLFSNYENLPCTIIEAFYAGLPAIGTRVGGVAEMIDDSNGIVIEQGDEEALFNAMNYMLDHPEKYHRASIRENAIRRYSMEQVGKTFSNQYMKILQPE